MYEVKYAGFIYPPPLCFSLSHSCVSYVHEAPGSVRHQKGNICNSSAPPGQAVLTDRWFVQCTQWGYAKKRRHGRTGQANREGGEEKMCLHPLLSLHPDPTLFHLRVGLPWKMFSCIVWGSSWSDPPPPPPPNFIHLLAYTDLQRSAACCSLRQHVK